MTHCVFIWVNILRHRTYGSEEIHKIASRPELMQVQQSSETSASVVFFTECVKWNFTC